MGARGGLRRHLKSSLQYTKKCDNRCAKPFFSTSFLQHKSLHKCVNVCDQREPGRSAGYEGLDAADMESIQRPPPPHHYAGLGGVHASGPGLDQHGYLVVVADPENEDHPQVNCVWKFISCAINSTTILDCLYFQITNALCTAEA